MIISPYRTTERRVIGHSISTYIDNDAYNYISTTIFNSVVIKYSDDELINLSKEQIKNIMIEMCKTYNDNIEFYDMWLTKTINYSEMGTRKPVDILTTNIYGKKIILTNL